MSVPLRHKLVEAIDRRDLGERGELRCNKTREVYDLPWASMPGR